MNSDQTHSSRSDRLIMTLQLQLRRHPLIWFAVLSLPLSWWAWPLYGLGLMPLPIASFGPFLAALIVLMVTEGKTGVVGLFRRMGRWRVGVGWYLIALATPVLLSAVAVLINIALGAQADLSLINIDWLDVLSTFAMVLLIRASAVPGRSLDGGDLRCRACNQDARPCAPRSSSA
jgi:hypothetical protein